MLTQGHILLTLLSLITAYNPEPDDFNFVITLTNAEKAPTLHRTSTQS